MSNLSSNYLLIIPIALLVSFGQLLVKWRSGAIQPLQGGTELQGFASFVADPVILAAYATGFIANLAWLYVVTKLPLTTAFPVYMGLTFALVLMGGWLFLSESITFTKVLAVLLILAGMVLALRTDA